MAEQVRIPDIGGATDVQVIEVMVKPGDVVAVEDSLVTLEGDKATMEIPAPFAGKVEKVSVNVGDKVGEGDLILTIAAGDAKAAETPEKQAPKKEASASKPVSTAHVPSLSINAEAIAEPGDLQDVCVPDIGGATNVDVIEVMVKVGDEINEEDSVITLEGDKATMEVPSSHAGVVEQLKVKVGDKLSEGDLILRLRTAAGAPATPPKKSPVSEAASTPSPAAPAPSQAPSVAPATSAPGNEMAFDDLSDEGDTHAGPGARRLANELGIDLSQLSGTGAKGRVTRADVQGFIKQSMQGGSAAATGSGLQLPSAPKIDFTKFGDIETKPLSKIQKNSGVNLQRNWVSIPHVTQFGESDITELEAFRQEQKKAAAAQGVKLTPLAFMLKAVVHALREFPHVNASLDPSGGNLILKKYFHIGVAVDTPNGLVVPVIRDVDQKGLFDLAKELAVVSEKARTKGLDIKDMQGGCFSISSLGGIGGTAFTPIINAPEVAILGVSRSYKKPVYKEDGSIVPRLMLPLSFSYDHRVIDGADGARFMVYLASRLADIRTLLL